MAEADKLLTGERILVTERDALLVIDAQPTFMPDGGLPVRGGDEVVPVIQGLYLHFPVERSFATKDRHPRGHISLASSYVGREPMSQITHDAWSRDMHGSVRMPHPSAKFTSHEVLRYLARVPGQAQVLWPDHAIAGTREAELHTLLSREAELHTLLSRRLAHECAAEEAFDYVLVKGTDPREDSYSGFKGNAGTPTELADVLQDRGVTRIFCCGLAFDYCVRFTAEDGLAAGFEVVVIEDATRAVGFPEGSVEATRASFHEKGIRLVQSGQIVSRK